MLVKKFIKSNFLQSFIPVFITLFFIISIVILIQITRVLEGVNIELIDIFKLYLYTSVKLILIVLPLSFFVAVCMCVNRLCKDNELIVLFTLGLNPKAVLGVFLKISIVFSLFLSILTIVFIPTTLKLYKNFVDYKKTISTLDIKPSSFGQEFGEYFVFVENKSDGFYENIMLFSPFQKNKKRLIMAKNAKLLNENANIKLILNNGRIYEIGKSSKDKTFLLKFDEFEIFTNISSDINYDDGILSYWRDFRGKKSKELVIYGLLSLFPLASVFFAFTIAVIVARYEKNFLYFKMFCVICPYFGAVSLFSNYHLITILGVLILYLIFGLLYFKKKVGAKF